MVVLVLVCCCFRCSRPMSAGKGAYEMQWGKFSLQQASSTRRGRGYPLQRSPNSLQWDWSSSKKAEASRYSDEVLRCSEPTKQERVMVLRCSTEFLCCSGVYPKKKKIIKNKKIIIIQVWKFWGENLGQLLWRRNWALQQASQHRRRQRAVTVGRFFFARVHALRKGRTEPSWCSEKNPCCSESPRN